MKLLSLGLARNSAGGTSWHVNDWTRLHRFLILGSEGGSYYATERQLTMKNAQAVLRCLKQDPQRAVRTIVDISVAGRAPRNDAAILALALASAVEGARKAALEALPQVCRTGTHLFMFVHYVKQCRGFGRALRRGLAWWYEGQPTDRLAYQLLKYRQRAAWTHRDVWRLCHPIAPTPAHQALFRYVVGAESGPRSVVRDQRERCYPPVGELPELVGGFESLQASSCPEQACRILASHPSLSWEMVPATLLGSSAVWRTLLPNLPMTAMVRNLARMQANGALDCNDAIGQVCHRLSQPQAIAKTRLHPLFLLSALHAYKSGTGRGGRAWLPNPAIVDALEAAFYLSFASVEASGKRTLLALDVSGSMSAPISGLNLNCREASGAMAMVTARTEANFLTMAFTSKLVPLDIGPKDRLEDALSKIAALSFGNTDCALPMVWAKKNKVPIDTFVIYTDNETWAGRVSPHITLCDYRQKMGIAARLVVVGMVSNGFTIADPTDAGMLDVVGFDTAAPQLISDFSRGDLAPPTGSKPVFPN